MVQLIKARTMNINVQRAVAVVFVPDDDNDEEVLNTSPIHHP